MAQRQGSRYGSQSSQRGGRSSREQGQGLAAVSQPDAEQQPRLRAGGEEDEQPFVMRGIVSSV